MENPKNWITLKKAAEDIELSPVTLRAYASGRLTPVLPAELVGRSYMVDRRLFQAWKATWQEMKDKRTKTEKDGSA